MIYRKFGKMNWDISAIGMGTWNIGNQWGEIDDITSYATVKSAFDHGVNLFDTAEAYGIPYGLSEKRLGFALTGIRHRAYIVSKIGHWGKRTGQGVPKNTPDMIRLSAHACLYRLRTDWIDVMLCHEKDIKDPSVYLEAFEILKQSGEIREYGISTNDIDVLKQFNVDGNCSVVELDYSLLNREAEQEILPYCQENNIAVLIRGPLAQGMLSGNYSKESVFTDSVRKGWNRGGDKREWFEENMDRVDKIRTIIGDEDMAANALRFVISHPSHPVAIPGAKSPEQAIANAEAGRQIFDDKTLDKFKDI